MLKDIVASEIDHLPSQSTSLRLAPFRIGNKEIASFLSNVGVTTGRGGPITPEGISDVAGIDFRYAFQPLGAKPADIQETIPTIASETAEETREKKSWDPECINHIFFTSSYPFGKQGAKLIAESIGAVNASTHDVYAACAGGAYAIQKAFAVAKPGDRVLIVGAEHYSAKMDDDLNRTLLSDGSAAFAFEVGTDFDLVYAETKTEPNDAIMLPIDETLYPENSYIIPVPRTKPNGEEVKFFEMDGQTVLRWVSRYTPMQKTIKGYIEAEEVANTIHVVTHQGSGRMATDFSHKFASRVPGGNVTDGNVSLIGNLGSASVLAELHHLFSTYQIKKGDAIVVSGFGGGLSTSVVVLQAKRDIS